MSSDQNSLKILLFGIKSQKIDFLTQNFVPAKFSVREICFWSRIFIIPKISISCNAMSSDQKSLKILLFGIKSQKFDDLTRNLVPARFLLQEIRNPSPYIGIYFIHPSDSKTPQSLIQPFLLTHFDSFCTTLM